MKIKLNLVIFLDPVRRRDPTTPAHRAQAAPRRGRRWKGENWRQIRHVCDANFVTWVWREFYHVSVTQVRSRGLRKFHHVVYTNLSRGCARIWLFTRHKFRHVGVTQISRVELTHFSGFVDDAASAQPGLPRASAHPEAGDERETVLFRFYIRQRQSRHVVQMAERPRRY